jgi:riboflavin synthase
MFTGIITNLGLVEDLQKNHNQDLLVKILTKNNINRKLEIGCSIACDGICLTLINKEVKSQNIILSFEASKETQEKTTLKNWKIKQLINLEFAARFGDEIGGHIVLGHVDDLAKITKITKLDGSNIFTFECCNKNLMEFIAPKCSVTINGASLTVNNVFLDKNSFDINIISHTFENTNFKEFQINNLVNFEIDVISRYIKGAEKFKMHNS